MRNLVDGVFLKSYNVWLMFECDYNVLIEKLNALGIPTDVSRKGYCTLNSKIFDDAYDYFICLEFLNEHLDSFTILPLFCKDNPQKTYKHIQQNLVRILGYPNKWYPMTNCMSPAYKKYYWKIGNVQIIHKLYERFYYEDTIQIKQIR